MVREGVVKEEILKENEEKKINKKNQFSTIRKELFDFYMHPYFTELKPFFIKLF